MTSIWCPVRGVENMRDFISPRVGSLEAASRHGTRLITLLDEIRDISDYPALARKTRDALIAKEVRNKVKRHGPDFWRQNDLDRGRP